MPSGPQRSNPWAEGGARYRNWSAQYAPWNQARKFIANDFYEPPTQEELDAIKEKKEKMAMLLLLCLVAPTMLAAEGGTVAASAGTGAEAAAMEGGQLAAAGAGSSSVLSDAMALGVEAESGGVETGQTPGTVRATGGSSLYLTDAAKINALQTFVNMRNMNGPRSTDFNRKISYGHGPVIEEEMLHHSPPQIKNLVKKGAMKTSPAQELHKTLMEELAEDDLLKKAMQDYNELDRCSIQSVSRMLDRNPVLKRRAYEAVGRAIKNMGNDGLKMKNVLEVEERDMDLKRKTEEERKVNDCYESILAPHRLFFDEFAVDYYLFLRDAHPNLQYSGNYTIDNKAGPFTMNMPPLPVKSVIFLLQQSTIEGSWGNEEDFKERKELNNFWGLKAAGKLLPFETFEEGFSYFLNVINIKWPSAVELFESGIFNKDEITDALNSGRYYDNPEQAYNTDGNLDKKNYRRLDGSESEYLDYGGKIMGIKFLNRFIPYLKEKIQQIKIDMMDLQPGDQEDLVNRMKILKKILNEVEPHLKCT